MEAKLFQFKNPHNYPKDRVHGYIKINIRNTNENTWAYAQAYCGITKSLWVIACASNLI